MLNARLAALLAAAAALLTQVPACAQAPASPFAAHIAKYEAAVVSVKTVASLKTSIGGKQADTSEEEQECSGVVVSPAGLVAVCLSSVDPTDLYSDYIEASEDVGENVQFTAELKSITLHFSDGREAPGEMAIRDKDLDIAIIRPKTALAAPAASVDLSDSAELGLMDDLLLIARMGRAGSWITVAGVEQVKGIFTKPRKMYFVPYSPTGEESDVGALAVTESGKVAGLHVYRNVPDGTDDMTYFMVVMPAKEIAALAKQAAP